MSRVRDEYDDDLREAIRDDIVEMSTRDVYRLDNETDQEYHRRVQLIQIRERRLRGWL